MTGGDAVRLLLHACCGPCLIEPMEALALDHEVVVAWANPNIHPLSEHDRRRDTLRAYVADLGADVVEAPYEPGLWMRAVAGVDDDPAVRCAACYRLRLGMTARMAAEGGYEAIATTLTVSPYQDPEAIREAGEQAAAEAGLGYLGTDFRARYRPSVERSREMGMYRQKYCGCLLSEVEAVASRSRRRDR
jgi:predicted adenine nucleotide alpha hydrolase (AANH) superfamily ATPase